MIPEEVKQDVLALLRNRFQQDVIIEQESMIGGGCINQAACATTNKGDFFIKWNYADRFPGMFEAEAKGLELLAGANAIKVPRVLGTGPVDGQSYIVQEYIQGGIRVPDFYRQFGQKLAHVHKMTSRSFGLDHNNYIGSLPQYNHHHDHWPDFFIEERIRPQLKMARDAGAVRQKHARQFDQLFHQLDGFFPEEPPALVHGDLWGGNHIVDNSGEPCILDPAVYFGHRETDIAFTHMFGGFDKKFYEGYNEVYPLANGFEERIDVYNLYPLMVHVNLFGGGYLASVESILQRFA